LPSNLWVMWFAHSAKLFCGHAQPQKTVPAIEYSATSALANMIHKPEIKKKSENHICQPNTTNAPFSGSIRNNPDTGIITSRNNIVIWTVRRFHRKLAGLDLVPEPTTLIGILEGVLLMPEDMSTF
jgi:hypothetical protein